MLESFGDNLNIVIFGGSGGIGGAFIRRLKNLEKVDKIYSFSRSSTNFTDDKIVENSIDIEDENSIIHASESIPKGTKLDIIIIATGLLHNDDGLKPEKSIRDINAENLLKSYMVNTVAPALIAKHFAKLLNSERKSVFTAISARVSSISDNRLGGWYAYRSAKTALNQMLKTLSIELTRRNKNLCIYGLHPGTVDTKLSEPFKANVAEGKLFNSDFASECLLKVIDARGKQDNGKLFDWENKQIDY